MVLHFVRGEDFPNQDQPAQQFADASVAQLAKGDARVRRARAVEGYEVRVMKPSAMAVGMCSSRWKAMRSGISARQLFQQLGRVLRLGGAGDCFLSFHVSADFVAVVVVVGEGGMDRGERDMRVAGDDLVGRHPLEFVASHDVLNTDAGPSDARPPTGEVGRRFDVFGDDCVHKVPIA